MEKPSQLAKRLRIINQQAIIDTVTSIDQELINRRISEGEQIRALAIAADDDLAQLAKQFCMKTGKPLGTFPLSGIARTIAIHGRERGRWLLELQQSNNISPEWLATDPQSLTQLAKADPCGWFVWAASHCWQKLNSCTNTLPHNGMDGINAMPDSASLANAANPDLGSPSLSARLADAKSRQTAYWQLQQIDTPQIVAVNETMRRVFALVNPNQFPTLKHSPLGTLVTVTRSPSALAEFRDWLGTVLATITKAITREHLRQCDPLYIRHSEICDIAQKHKGMALFRNQERLDKTSSLDPEIMLALRDFAVDELTKSRRADYQPKPVTLKPNGANHKVVKSASQIKIPETVKPKLSLAELLKGGK